MQRTYTAAPRTSETKMKVRKRKISLLPCACDAHAIFNLGGERGVSILPSLCLPLHANRPEWRDVQYTMFIQIKRTCEEFKRR